MNMLGTPRIVGILHGGYNGITKKVFSNSLCFPCLTANCPCANLCDL